ncbi:pilus assembly protein [Corallococcus exiguus]|uniref:pilus assembly protein TadG-related protein n=1 Tax=Corallococcus TaxID=83461 RepID=UPI000ECA9A51|nr:MULTISPECIES: pilus assembly protein TadG-related protein [Corallococcus]NNB94797.1 pilus assembly protein [Corallococcus exiguus]NNC02342.1 pilus assembly protein [Corallococcus exiguus]NNC18592.1 pilus assembly protein [Corallococcus exiguus]NPC49316.1 pilus assembly protein [Corallococcus exiguus]RKH84322.1 pilus assembly protein [Corallococcus sp. AB032C]
MQPARLLKSGARGQALVLFSLTFLLLTLMVLLTLGFGMRAKERVEIQMAADAAAYSQAVSTARTFNAIAVMNRAQIAHMVAMAGTQSMISYGSQQYAARQTSPCAMPGNDWSALDQAAATQVQVLQGRAGSMFRAELAIYNHLVGTHLANQNLTRLIAKEINPELAAQPEGANKSLSEVSGGASSGSSYDELMQQEKTGSVPATSGAVMPTGGGQGTATLNATMGSLGWTWVHNRGSGSAGFGSGAAAHNPGFHHYGSASAMDSSTYQTISGRNSWAHDHGRAVTGVCPDGTPYTAGATDAWVMSDERQSPEDQHVYGAKAPPGQGAENNTTVDERHTLGACVVCPGIWPYSVGFNAGLLHGNADENDYGQPKLYAMLHRDYASDARRAKPDPWNLLFTFKFANQETEFDNAAPLGRILPTGREDVQRNQVALAAGLAYYHRPRPAAVGGGWEEPPNFLNPFWRATLVSTEGARDDKPANSLQQAGFSEHAEALRRLDNAGYRGGSSTGGKY